MKKSHIMELGGGGGRKSPPENPSVLNRYLFVEKRQEKIKPEVRDASDKLKRKLIISSRNIQHFKE